MTAKMDKMTHSELRKWLRSNLGWLIFKNERGEKGILFLRCLSWRNGYSAKISGTFDGPDVNFSPLCWPESGAMPCVFAAKWPLTLWNKLTTGWMWWSAALRQRFPSIIKSVFFNISDKANTTGISLWSNTPNLFGFKLLAALFFFFLWPQTKQNKAITLTNAPAVFVTESINATEQ